MDDQILAGVRAIVARNEAVAKDAVGVLFAGLKAQQMRNNAQTSSRRWIAIAQLFEEEGRKLIRTTTLDARRLDATAEAFPILEAAFREFLGLLEERYFDASGRAASFGGSRPLPDQADNPLSAHWWQAKERLQLEIEVSRAEFRPAAGVSPARAANPRRNTGGKPLAEHWDQMWAAIAVQLWLGRLQPQKQGDITLAMKAWLGDHDIDVSDTAIVERARCLWREIEASN
jgi:hypothetical protein